MDELMSRDRPFPAGSYNIDLLQNSRAEVARLERRAQLRLAGFPTLLQRHGFPSLGRVLEIGCGQGLRTQIMAELAPNADITGVDRNGQLLHAARANTRRNCENLFYQQHDLYALPFPDASVDFVYARLVFMHLEAPLTALREMSRLLKPGGRILIEDADRDCMFFEPAPTTFVEYWRAVQEGQRRRGGDPNVGRKLASYLKGEGFTDLNIEAQPIVGDGADIAFLISELLTTLNEYLDDKDRSLGEAALSDLGQLAQDPRATFFHFWFAVSGAKTSENEKR